MKRLDMFQFASSALHLWEFATVSLHKPFKTVSYLAIASWVLWIQALLAFKARCFGHPSLSHGSLRH